jgi:hypothetical protein
MPRLGGRSPRRALVLSLTTLLVLGGLLPAIAGARGATEPVTLILSPGGTLDTNLSVEIQNGSAIRFALDGNFTPLLAELPLSSANRSIYASEIALLESNPFTGGLFGNRDGTVEPYEVTDFDELVQEESRLLPAGTLTGGVAFQITLDGQGPTDATVEGVQVADALGPDSSAAPVTVSVLVNYAFPLSGSSHTLGLTWPSSPVVLSTLLNFQLTFLAPAGDSITGSTGFTSTSVNNDLLGFAPGKLNGQFSPATSTGVTIQFGTAFPLGIIVTVVGIAGAVVLLLLFLRVRSRRRRLAAEKEEPPAPAAPPPPPAE